jgi:hypothetical protein
MNTQDDTSGSARNLTVSVQAPRVVYKRASSAPVYGLGFIGALVYYFQHATGFGNGVAGFFKALVWPAFLVYECLKALKM